MQRFSYDFVFTSRGLTINRFVGPSNYFFRGSALIMTNGLVQIEETL